MRTVSLVSLLLLAPLAAQAQLAGTSRTVGMGGAVRGDPVGNGAVLYNPAGLSRAYLYGAEGNYTRGPNKTNAVGVNIVDSKTQPQMAVGLAYSFEFSDGDADTELQGHDGRLAFALPLVANKVSLGVGLHYLNYDWSTKAGTTTTTRELEGFTVDTGLLLSLSPTFHVGLVGENLINLDDPSMPRKAGGGVAYTGDFFTLDLDVMADFDSADSVKPIVAAGFEMLVAEIVPFRLGFERDQATERSFASGGLGFMSDDNGQLSLAYRQNVDDAKDFRFIAGLVMFL